MKRVLNKVFYTIPFFFLLVSCNNNKSNEQKQEAVNLTTSEITSEVIDKLLIDCSTTGLGNITIAEKEAKDMINRFDTIYVQKSPANLILKDSFWLSKCFVNTMSDYIRANAALGVSGMRFIFGAEKRVDNSFSSWLFITPTQDDTERGFRTDLWDKQIESINCGAELDIFYPRFNQSGTMINYYEKEYRKNLVPGTGTALKDSLSRKVWFSRCSILLISELLNSTSNVDGLNVKMGAYEKFDINIHPGQAHAHQSTVILVPTRSKKDDWTVIPEIKQKILTLFGRGALNHGALCPNQCN